jgi:hypothetical protein
MRTAFRALHTDDRNLKGIAFEYLESTTLPNTRHLLLPLLEADAENRVTSKSDGALARLLKTEVRINQSLKIARPVAGSS